MSSIYRIQAATKHNSKNLKLIKVGHKFNRSKNNESIKIASCNLTYFDQCNSNGNSSNPPEVWLQEIHENGFTAAAVNFINRLRACFIIFLLATSTWDILWCFCPICWSFDTTTFELQKQKYIPLASSNHWFKCSCFYFFLQNIPWFKVHLLIPRFANCLQKSVVNIAFYFTFFRKCLVDNCDLKCNYCNQYKWILKKNIGNRMKNWRIVKMASI